MIKFDRRDLSSLWVVCSFLSVLVLMSFPLEGRMNVDECERLVRFVVLVLDLLYLLIVLLCLVFVSFAFYVMGVGDLSSVLCC